MLSLLRREAIFLELGRTVDADLGPVDGQRHVVLLEEAGLGARQQLGLLVDQLLPLGSRPVLDVRQRQLGGGVDGLETAPDMTLKQRAVDVKRVEQLVAGRVHVEPVHGDKEHQLILGASLLLAGGLLALGPTGGQLGQALVNHRLEALVLLHSQTCGRLAALVVRQSALVGQRVWRETEARVGRQMTKETTTPRGVEEGQEGS